MRKAVSIFCLLVWLVLTGQIVHAQDVTEQPVKRYFRSISVDKGLSQSTVFSIVQDTLGFMWMATQDGLNRYDGESFTVYRPSKSDKTSLQSNYIRSIYLDDKGLLWVGGNQGVSRYDYATNSFENYQLPRKSGEWYISSIVQDAGKLIWASSSAGEIFYLDQASAQFKQINFDTSVYNIKSVTRLALLKNTLLVGTDVGLFKMNLATKKLMAINLGVNRPRINEFFIDGQWLLIGTEGHGLIKYNINTGVTSNYRHSPSNPAGLADNDVRGISKDVKGNIWLGTFKGLSILDAKDGTFQNYYHQASIPYTISQNSVRCVYRDNQDGMWMGTFYGGINYYHHNDIKFNLLNQNTGTLSLNDQVVNVIKQDHKGDFWIGTNDKGLNYWNRNAGTIKYYTYKESGQGALSSNNIKAIAFDQNGKLLVGTHNEGLNYFDPATGKSRVYRHSSTDPKSITGDMVYALLKDHKGRMWVGTRSGLDEFNVADQSFNHFYMDKAGKRLTSDEVTYLLEDSKGRIWIGTTNGVNIFYPDNLLFDTFPGTLLSNDVVSCIVEDNKNRIWIGTRDGLNLFDEKTRSFVTFNTRKDFLKGTIYGILVDDEGYLWISTNKGLVKFHPDTRKLQVFDNKDGLQNNQFNLYAFCKAADGMMLFGGINGISYFYPKALKQDLLKLKVTFTGLEVFNKTVVPDDGSNILDQHIDQAEKLTFKHEYKQFTIFFNAFNYISPSKTKYEYKLEGFNSDWQITEGTSKASYTNLQPGKYVFQVRAIGPSGESSAVKRLVIVISPPWWNSNWFYLLMIILAAAAGYMVYRVVSERIRTLHQLKLERMEREKVDYINQMKMEFFTNVSHEFRTPLTLILAPLEEIMSKPVTDKPLRKHHELMMHNAKRLYHLVDQLFEFKKTELGTKKLKVNKADMVSFIHEVYGSFTTLSEKNKIKYTFRSTEARLSFYFDKDAIEKIMFNLLSNAFKYTPEGGSINIEFAKKNGDAVIKVSDTGIGIAEQHRDRIFDRFYQVDGREMNLGSGVGLAFTKRLVELHHGTITVDSVAGKGSVFIVVIPLADELYEADEHNEVPRYELSVENVIHSQVVENEELVQIETEGAELEKEKLLVIDDNPEIVGYLKNYFNKIYEVSVAYDGKEALALLEEESVDLIICDVMMPELDGIHFCKRIKQNIQTCHIPVILLTAKIETNQQIKGLEVGADDYVTKPFSIALLEAKLQNISRSRKRLKEYYSSSKEIVPENIAFNTLDEDFLRAAIAIIESHITESDFSVDKFSREIGMSRSNLYLKLKAITGESATDFIKRIRFKKAVELMESRQYTIAQVAYMSGFNSPSYFSTAFKQYYDCMPTEYLAKKELDLD
ncbi:MAG: two-component regulator propeller domain-containing protein [Candidatus Pedobacter colombiensis]|uniref:histidine kinase n=1 Tax=Candidatus Pedobacter colombiensis TaxID=3121371 RepID=A0AAJ5W677_9SPHI|nr:two-component regulator propeller domain-containing protein [Pedobacter sp.]WEK17729.1 MAG: two-component regulator propeller domain-containing protein [Pedobacter sp.]